ncbi:hypothetical protein U1872_04780 [Sphingomonas sp. RB3P16]|uniref:hypothetical protein n=1 Tax=Parasphingomonas frigoris TaxID=3096163 RepID=UPI002FC6A2D3
MMTTLALAALVLLSWAVSCGGALWLGLRPRRRSGQRARPTARRSDLTRNRGISEP